MREQAPCVYCGKVGSVDPWYWLLSQGDHVVWFEALPGLGGKGLAHVSCASGPAPAGPDLMAGQGRAPADGEVWVGQRSPFLTRLLPSVRSMAVVALERVWPGLAEQVVGEVERGEQAGYEFLANLAQELHRAPWEKHAAFDALCQLRLIASPTVSAREVSR